MKLKKLLLIGAITAAFASVTVIPSIAAVDEESIQVGWVQMGNDWIYLNQDGSRKTGWLEAEEGDGRGSRVWYYLNGSGIMVANQTLNIGGTDYAFGEDGSYVEGADYQGAARGALNTSTFTNGWSNIKVTFPAISYNTDKEDLLGYEDYFADKDYAAIGQPKLTYDLMLETNSNGDLFEIYYADMAANQAMTSDAFAQAMAVILNKTDYYTVKADVAAATVGNQTYSKISLVNDVNIQKDLYCRKQDSYMVVISTTAETDRMGAMNSLVSSVTTAH